MRTCLLALTLLACLPLFISAQSVDTGEQYVLHIRKSEVPLRLDGELDEAAWQSAQVAKDFFMNFPFDTAFAALQTEVRMTYDDQFLYVGAVVYQDQATYITNSLKRDFSGGSSDVFVVEIDPFKDKLNAFHFGISPFNVQREGLIDNGSNLTLDWDNKWYSQVRNHADHWTVELAIPFKTLRYRVTSGSNTWRINFGRNALKQNEVSTWSPIPRQFRPGTLAFTGTLVWDTPPPSPGLNASVIPYVTARTERDFEFKLPGESKFNAGADAKIALTPSLNLDLTFNPDFSQVDVDRQITNLSRFELFFPERRQFFLENEDLFSRFGFPDSRPFFSRRIGLANGLISRTTTEGQLIQVRRNLSVPIVAGMRLSGKLDNNWRIGLLNMQTAQVGDIRLNPANYSVGVLQRRVFDRSTIGAVFVNKENFMPAADGKFELNRQGYNRVAGLEYNLYSKDNKWESEIFYHRSLTSGNNKDAQSASVFVGYNTLNWRVWFGNQYLGANYRADVGFVPRRGLYSIFNQVEHTIFPKNPRVAKKILAMSIGLENNIISNTTPDFKLADRRHELSFELQFPGYSELQFGLNNEFIYLFSPFDPTNLGGEQLPEGSEYNTWTAGVSFESDQRKLFTYEFEVGGGQFFNGNIFVTEGAFGYRWQPYGTFAMAFSYNDIQLPKPYNSAGFWLIGPRAELAFSRNVFFSTFVQLNSQSNNININSRLQWRFKPVSDLFLVYTDNYFNTGLFENNTVKNRALVLKVTYWLNL